MASILENNTTTIDELITMANNLPDAGSDLPELTNEGTAADLLSGKELINSEGEKVTGTIATKTASNLTASGATVTVPAGYYASQATKSVATATQATPSVSIDSAGKITATATQTAGYVSAGTKTGTKQLTTQAAKTVTPTKSSQTAVAKNVYTTGVITVAAIPDQYQDITAPLSELNAANGGTAATTISAAVDNAEAHASSQEALIAQIAEALEGKAAGDGSGSSSGVEYEIVTIPAGTGKVTYSLPRITAAYGATPDSIMEFEGTGGLLSLRNNSLIYIDLLEKNSLRGYRMETSSYPIYYSNGVIGVEGLNRPNSIEAILINDPSATAISM